MARCGVVSLMDLMRALTGEVVIPHHVESGSKGDHFDLNLLAELAVMLGHIAHVIESEIHGGWDIDGNSAQPTDAAAFGWRRDWFWRGVWFLPPGGGWHDGWVVASS